MARNITVAIDEDVLQAARVAAARRGVSISALLREQLLRIARTDEQYEVARRAALEWMERGASLGLEARVSREDLHDRDALR
jgi:antitoxin component of RelBE/YafQ-DinJ toxin-antitoxin module